MNKNLDLEYKHEWLQKMADVCEASSTIDSTLFDKYEVKRGLRDLNGQGVLTGLTEISEIRSYTVIDHDMVPCEGKLYYQGIDIEEIVDGFLQEKRFGYEEVVYLLLFGELPTESQLEDLKDILAEYRKSLPSSFVRDIIMKAPSSDLMNTLGRSVLTLYSYDTKADDTTTENVLRQCLELVALLPMFAVYGYQAANYFHEGSSFFLHPPKEEYSTAENILHMLRPDSKFTPLEAKILDIALVLHAEHGGGNNSTFTDHVVTSSGTDTYAAISAALGSLKGPRHGGANKKVSLMFEDMKKNVHDWEDDEEIKTLWSKLYEINNVDIILIMIYTGLRPTELLEIQTENVHLDEKYMVGGMKTEAGKDRIIPLNDKIIPLVKNRYDPNKKYLINNKFGNHYTYGTYMNGNFNTCMGKLKMKHLPHDGRHTFASLMDNAGANDVCIKLIMGHSMKNDTTKGTYTHKTLEELLTEVNKI